METSDSLMLRYVYLTLFLISFSIVVNAQQMQKLHYGVNTLTGTIVLKTLMHPIYETPIKDCMVLKLSKKVKFIAETDSYDESDIITDEISIYGSTLDDVKSVEPELLYKKLINKRVSVKANIFYAPSGHYPLLANMGRIISFKIIN